MAAARMRVGGQSPARQILMLLASLAVVSLVAAAGGVAAASAQSFYAGLIKPEWAPPAWLFGPVWTALYLMMAVAAWLVWRSAGSVAAAADALLLHGVQLLLNGLWSWLFFVWQLGALSVVEIVLLWLALWFTLLRFSAHNRLAGALLLPYLLWVSFATVLTVACWHLNPDIL